MVSVSEVLIIRGLLPIETLDQLRDHGDEAVVGEFIERGLVTPSQVSSAKAEVAGLSFVELSEYPVDRAAVALVPAQLCRRHNVLPIHATGTTITLAMVEPGDVLAMDDVRALTRMHVVAVVAEKNDLLGAINRFHRADNELSDLTTAIEEEAAPSQSEELALRDADPDDAPIVRFVNLIIGQAIQDLASDIHIEPGEFEMRVRYRIDGVLHDVQKAPKNIQNGVISRLKIMSDINIAERRRPQDGRMSVQHGGQVIDLRVATLPTVFGEKVVMRILDNNATRRDIGDLGMLERNLTVYRNSYTKPYGMILVTGPTGSGKSTTLYTTLHAVSRPEVNVITVEDPVEYRMEGVNQVQVNPKAGLTFASALRSILRSDPDVVLIGEIRDQETAQIAIEASLTGHLVLSTLHTNDAPSAITRLIEMDIEPFLVGSALDCVVAQRLARRLCDRCKQLQEYDAPHLDALGFGRRADELTPRLYHAVGCSACSGTGYRGRLALHEVMMVSEEIERLAVGRASSVEIMHMATQQGMLTLRQDGWAKVRAGLTSIEEVLRVVA